MAVRVLPQPISFLSTLPVRGATFPALTPIRLVIFLSTLPARGATVRKALTDAGFGISIHAPREGSDLTALRSAPRHINFYPRSP